MKSEEIQFEFAPGDDETKHYYMDVRFYLEIHDINSKMYPWMSTLRSHEEILFSFESQEQIGGLLVPTRSVNYIALSVPSKSYTLLNNNDPSLNALYPKGLTSNNTLTLSWSFSFGFWFKFSKNFFAELKNAGFS